MFKRYVMIFFWAALAFSKVIANELPVLIRPVYSLNHSQLENLWKKSPFERKVVPSLDREPSSTYVLTGFGEIGDKYYATVFNRETKSRLMLSEELENNGRLVDLHLDPDQSKTTATIEINGEIFFTKFESIVSPAPPTPASPASRPKTSPPARPKRPSASRQSPPTVTQSVLQPTALPQSQLCSSPSSSDRQYSNFKVPALSNP